MHDEELAIFMEVRLWDCGNRAPVEIGNHLGSLVDAKRDQAIAQVIERFAPGCIWKLPSLKDWPSVDARIDVMDGDPNWNMVQQRPLGSAHAADFRQQAEVYVEDSDDVAHPATAFGGYCLP